MKRAFKMTLEAFFIIVKRLSLKQINLFGRREPEFNYSNNN